MHGLGARGPDESRKPRADPSERECLPDPFSVEENMNRMGGGRPPRCSERLGMYLPLLFLQHPGPPSGSLKASQLQLRPQGFCRKSVTFSDTPEASLRLNPKASQNGGRGHAAGCQPGGARVPLRCCWPSLGQVSQSSSFGFQSISQKKRRNIGWNRGTKEWNPDVWRNPVTLFCSGPGELKARICILQRLDVVQVAVFKNNSSVAT